MVSPARIAIANCGTPWSQTFSLDPFGNISKTGSITFQPTYNLATNRFQTIPGGTPTYDANGNLTYDLSHTYTWDAEGKTLAIDTVNLTYDALGRMVEQNRSGSYTEIVYSPRGGKLALMTGQTLQKAFVPLPGGTTAVYASSGLAYYRHADWLGSSRLASTPSRGLYYDVAYAPYGESYAGTGTTDLNFTGQNQDTVSGMHDFLYREYHAVQGRWISPDLAGVAAVSLTNPQTWNRYAYVMNSPVTLVDPLGLLTNCTPSHLENCGGSGSSGGTGAGGWDEFFGSVFGDSTPQPLIFLGGGKGGSGDWLAQLTKALQALANRKLNKDCSENVLGKVGLSGEQFSTALKKNPQFLNGVTSTDLMAGAILPNNLAGKIDASFQVGKWNPTVADLFSSRPGQEAVTSTVSSNFKVYVRPDSISSRNGGANADNEAMIFHEALHFAGRLSDSAIQKDFGIPVQDATSNIDDYIITNCFTL
jgi:RHS repeat-associated protein